MLNRKDNKSANPAGQRGRPRGRPAGTKAHRPHRRFVISHKAHNFSKPPVPESPAEQPKANSATQAKAAYANKQEAPRTGKLNPAPDLTETIKTLIHLSQEHGHITYDDIN